MKKQQMMSLLLSMLVTLSSSAHAGVTAGSRDSGFIVGSSGKLSGSLALNNASIRVENSSDASDAIISGSRFSLERTYDGQESILLDGSYTMGGDITLGDGDRLLLNTGVLQADISVSADSTATISGDGTFNGEVTIGEDSTLLLDLGSNIEESFTFNANNTSEISLLNDLRLVLTQAQISNSGYLDTNGHQFVLIGDGSEDSFWDAGSYTEDSIDYPHVTTFSSDSTRIVINGDVRLDTPWKLSGDSVISGDKSLLSLAVEDALTIDANTTLSLENIRLRTGDGDVTSPISFGASSVLSLQDVTALNIDATTGYNWPILRVERGAVTAVGDTLWDDVSWNASNVELNDDLILNANGVWTVNTGAALVINGNGCAVDVSTDGAKLVFTDADLYISNASLVGLGAGKLVGGSESLHLADVTLIDASGRESIGIVGSVVDGSGSGDTAGFAHITPAGTDGGEFFSENVSFTNGAIIDIKNRINLEAAWTFGGESVINGNGNVLDLSSEDAQIVVAAGKKMTLSNVVIYGWSGDADAGKIKMSDKLSEIHFSNVTFVMSGDISLNQGKWIADGQSTIITGNYELSVAEHADFDTDETSYTLTVNGCTLWYDTLAYGDGDNISPMTNSDGRVSLTGPAVATQGRIARVVELAELSAAVDTLNTTITNVSNDLSEDLSSAVDTLNTTITNVSNELAEDLSTAVETLNTTITTVSEELSSDISDLNSELDTLEAEFDALGTVDLTFTGDATVAQSLFLYADTTEEGDGVQVYFENEASMTLNGAGRSFIFGDTRTADVAGLMFLNGANVTLENIGLEGVQSHHIVYNDSGSVTFGDYTTIWMTQNDTLNKSYTFATTNADSAAILDLGGHTLDLGSYALNVTGVNAKLIIRNGIITGVNNSSKLVVDSGASVELQNVRIELEADTTFAAGSLVISGTTTLAGAGYTLTNSSVNAAAFNLLANGSFVIENEVTYFHAAGSSASLMWSEIITTMPGASYIVTDERGRVGTCDIAETARIVLFGGIFKTREWTLAHVTHKRNGVNVPLYYTSVMDHTETTTVTPYPVPAIETTVAYLPFTTGRLVADHTAKLMGNISIDTGSFDVDLMPSASVTVESGTIKYIDAV